MVREQEILYLSALCQSIAWAWVSVTGTVDFDRRLQSIRLHSLVGKFQFPQEETSQDFRMLLGSLGLWELESNFKHNIKFARRAAECK